MNYPVSIAPHGPDRRCSEGIGVDRPVVRGKFLFVGDDKFYVKGVTYGPFNPEPTSCEYGEREQVASDFAHMASRGFNTVRVYTLPPRWLLDEAAEAGLRVFVGLPWEQHLTFLDVPDGGRAIIERLRVQVRGLADHPALLAFAVGNEIPAGIVRWHGKDAIERFIEKLYRMVKSVDPAALVTYVNYPTTEYLELPFVDFVSFNVYLEDRPTLRKYLDRLQNLALDRPLVMAEVGLDSMRNGLDQQAETLAWQVETVFAAGCAGVFLFAWTDEWHRGGHDILDWDFGLTDRERIPKPALESVSRALWNVPIPFGHDAPRFTVCVCTYNGCSTIGETLRGLARLAYDNFEVLVINDGSTDDTDSVIDGLVTELNDYLDVRVVTVENGGLSRARNVGYQHATGDIVAYIDDDAFPDPHWLHYLAEAFMSRDVAGVGGPNLPVPEDGFVAQCVAASPGGPNHVLRTDDIAEHIPGCNMAFRRDVLEAHGGFDEQFRIAGDDVDLCWRVQDAGGVIGFHAGAMVWHHRRSEVRGYLRQQRNYGRAEAMLEQKWPEKYNHYGHVDWGGRIYGGGLQKMLPPKPSRVHYGVWGSELFQSLYNGSPDMLRMLPLMPEWYIVSIIALLFAMGSSMTSPLWLIPPLALLPAIVIAVFAAINGMTASMPGLAGWNLFRGRLVVSWLHFCQPWVRLRGRMQDGLTPWRLPVISRHWSFPRHRVTSIWSETWASASDRLQKLLEHMRRVRGKPVTGGAFDRWDLQLRGGLMGSVRILLAVEDHGGARQMVRIRSWPYMSRLARYLILGSSAIAIVLVLMSFYWAAAWFAAVAGLLLVRVTYECGVATVALSDVLADETEQAEAEAQAVYDAQEREAEICVKERPRGGVAQPVLVGAYGGFSAEPGETGA